MAWLPYFQSALGLAVFVGIAWALSENRRAFPTQTVIVGIGLQILLAVLLLGIPVVQQGLYSLNSVVDAIQAATAKGTSFVFGFVGGGKPPFAVTDQGSMVTLAFTILPIVLVMSAL